MAHKSGTVSESASQPNFTKNSGSEPEGAPIFDVDKALESYRDNGLDLATAVGEIVDNSIQAKARRIRVRTTRTAAGITEIAFSDDGEGIDERVLEGVLSLGFSTRYGDRSGLGRFGMGLKIATLSQAQRIDVYTTVRGDDTIRHTYLDLDLVRSREQERLRALPIPSLPERYADMMRYDGVDDGADYRSGTLVVWSKVDRLREGGRYGGSTKEALDETLRFLSRAYRKFIEDGLRIEFNGKPVELHDPTFLLPNPRITKLVGEDLRGTIVHSFEIDLDDGHKRTAFGRVQGVVTLAPERFRLTRYVGGRDLESAHRISADIEGHISILRNGREINYGVVPKLLPSAIKDIDRFIAIEISFPATADEYFSVRNVKRGAEPTDKLRSRIREELKKPVRDARREIQRVFLRTDNEREELVLRHAVVQDVVNTKNRELLPSRAGSGLSDREVDVIVRDILTREGGSVPRAEQISAFRARLEAQAIQYLDSAWPGKLMFEVRHLNGRFVCTLNRRHPLITGIYDPLSATVEAGPGNMPSAAFDLIKRAVLGFDVLFLGYGRAESMTEDPERTFESLRDDWGKYVAAFLDEAMGAENR